MLSSAGNPVIVAPFMITYLLTQTRSHGVLDWVEFNAPPDTVSIISEAGLHSQSLDCYGQTNNKENTQYKSQKHT